MDPRTGQVTLDDRPIGAEHRLLGAPQPPVLPLTRRPHDIRASRFPLGALMTPADHGFHMPAEWEPHARTWMAFPTANPTFTDLEAARRTWGQVANTIAAYEPVVMIATHR
ncbi:agmatine deiminase family protein [Nonomuraea dietziae]|uniref:agmatine deiminase family protein n=1 Tax=Nonomuraea dietziae TaxID=65515 RepID=UPI0031DF2A05